MSIDLCSLSWNIKFSFCDRECYPPQQLIYRSGQAGHLSPRVVSATTSAPLQLLMPQSLELPYRVSGMGSSHLFTSMILRFLLPSTPVQQATNLPGLHCKRVAPMVSYHLSLLTLLLWWGQALVKQSQWQIDSSPD